MKLPALSRLLPWRKRAAEGAYRPGPYLLPEGWLSAKAGKYLNWWQMGYSLDTSGGSSAIVEACRGAYAQTIAMCPGDHWRKLENGGRERVTNSALSRVLKRPNDYQSLSDFLLNLVYRLYTDGEAFAYAVRNNRFEITELHLMRRGRAAVAEDGSIFYALYGNDVAERRLPATLSGPVPARDVLHVRLHTPVDPLKGVSPILATQLSMALSGAAMHQQIAFYLNQARPSFMLETDQQLTRDQITELRETWNLQTQGENAGGTPILAWGLKAKAVTGDAKDNELAALLKISQEEVALAFQMPLQVLGLGGTPFASTEALMSSWKSRGLGFALNHIEEAFGLLFGLGGVPDEYLEFNTNALMRSSFKERIEALAAGVIGGILSSDEARNEEDLPVVPGGHGAMPRVQQQVVPLSYGSSLQPPDPNAKPAVTAPQTPTDEDEDDDSERNVVDISARDLLATADEIDRRAVA
jgi:HK97 family phage portal protein